MSFVIPIVLHRGWFFLTAGRMIAFRTENRISDTTVQNKFKKSAYTTDTFMDCCAMCLLSTLLPVNSCCLKVRKNCLIWKVLVHWGFAILPETPRTTPVSHYSNKWLNFPSNSMSAKSSSTNEHLYLRTVKLRGNTELEGLKPFI